LETPLIYSSRTRDISIFPSRFGSLRDLGAFGFFGGGAAVFTTACLSISYCSRRDFRSMLMKNTIIAHPY
jgi:hypothetical protein